MLLYKQEAYMANVLLSASFSGLQAINLFNQLFVFLSEYKYVLIDTKKK